MSFLKFLLSNSISALKVNLPDVREALTGGLLSFDQESPTFSKLAPEFRGEIERVGDLYNHI